MDHVFLFGAGASSASEHVLFAPCGRFHPDGALSERPPSGKGLYGKLSEYHPRAWARPNLPRRFGELFQRTEDFEEGMLALLTDSSDMRNFQTFTRCMKAMSVYFASFAPDASRRTYTPCSSGGCATRTC
jgi:hypothetical protein